jgi:hypothetical protein
VALRVVACRRIGLGCIRRSSRRLAVGCGESCGQIEVGAKTRGEQALPESCSPRVGITLAGARQARLRRRKSE